MTWTHHKSVFARKPLQSELRVLSVLLNAEVIFLLRHQHL